MVSEFWQETVNVMYETEESTNFGGRAWHGPVDDTISLLWVSFYTAPGHVVPKKSSSIANKVVFLREANNELDRVSRTRATFRRCSSRV